jgi:hypothetical protein
MLPLVTRLRDLRLDADILDNRIKFLYNQLIWAPREAESTPGALSVLIEARPPGAIFSDCQIKLSPNFLLCPPVRD